MRHILAFLVLLALLIFVLAPNVAPDPYTYDEADYMFAASLGFPANYTDSPTLPFDEFIRLGLTRGQDSGQRQALSELVRAKNDVVFYRHWHGPLYIDSLIPIASEGLSERRVRAAMLLIPALSLTVMYFGLLWLIPGGLGFLTALMSGILLVSSAAVAHSTELAPHQLFALCSIGFLILVAKTMASGQRIYWYPAVLVAGLAFCTLELAFVFILTLAICGFKERRRLEAGWSFAGRSVAVFCATVFVIWPAAIYKQSFAKAYLFMVYLALFRRAPWGNEGFLEAWRERILDSPLEWMAVLAALAIYVRMPAKADKRLIFPILIFSTLMVVATLRVLTSSTRYSLLFMPALDMFAALAVTPFVAALRRRAMYAVLALFCGVLGFREYRLVSRHINQDPRPPAVLMNIREDGLADKTLLVPQEELPMIHYYFPQTRLHGYWAAQPVVSGEDHFTPDAVLYRGYPVRIERSR